MARWSEDDKARALAALDANGGNVKGTSRQLGIPQSTLRGWRNGIGTNATVTKKRDENARELKEEMRDLVYLLLEKLPDKLDKASAKEMMVGLGIAVDKLQLLEGKPTGHIKQSGELVVSNAREQFTRLTDKHAATGSAPPDNRLTQ